MNHSVFVILTFLIFAGCSTRATVTLQAARRGDGMIDYRRANAELEDRKARILLFNGDVYDAENVIIGEDTTCLKSWSSALFQKIPTREILTIERRNVAQPRVIWNISRTHDRWSDFRDLNRQMGNSEVMLFLVNGDSCAAEEVWLSSDTTVFKEPSRSPERRILTREIRKIETRNHFLGLIDGFFIGFSGGGLFGFGLGTSLSTPEDYHHLIPAFFTASGALLGSVGGVIYGVFRGRVAEYTIMHRAQ